MTSIVSTLTALTFMVFSAISKGQTETQDAVAPKPIKGRSAYVIYTGGGAFFNKPVLIRSGKQNVSVQLSKRSASAQIKVHKDGIVAFVRETPGNPEQPFTPYALANIPAGVQKSLIVLTPLTKPKGTYYFSAEVVDLSKFRKGDWLFVNQTPTRVGVKLGETSMALKPNGKRVFDAQQFRKPTNLAVSYNYFHTAKKKWKMLSASTVVVRPTRREICIFSWNPRKKKVDYSGITFVE